MSDDVNENWMSCKELVELVTAYLEDVLDAVGEFRRSDAKTPVVLMGYANPIERMGFAAFVAAANKAGVDGVLIVDYPPEESADWLAAIDKMEALHPRPVILGGGPLDPGRLKRMGD